MYSLTLYHPGSFFIVRGYPSQLRFLSLVFVIISVEFAVPISYHQRVPISDSFLLVSISVDQVAQKDAASN